MRSKFSVWSISSKIASIVATFALLLSGALIPINASSAAESDSANSSVDYAGVFNAGGYGATATQLIPETADFTAEAWVNLTDSTANRYDHILGQGAGTNQFYLKQTEGLLIAYRNGWGGELVCGPVKMNQWVHIAVSVGTTFECFIDGALAFTKSGLQRSVISSSNGFAVGAWTSDLSNAGTRVKGQVDQVKIWNGLLTENQVAESMHAYGSTGVSSAPSLLAHYDFNESSTPADGKIYNRAGASHDLTISGTVTWADVKEVLSGGNIDSNRSIVYRFPRTYLTAQGGWTIPSNLTSIEALTVGGGGGGGENVGNGGSGGSAAYHSGFSLTSGSTLAVKVGQGGAPGVFVDDTMSGTNVWGTDSANTNNTSVASARRDGGTGQSSTLAAGSQTLSAPGGIGGGTYWSNNQCVGSGRVTGNTPVASAGTGGTTNSAGAAGGEGKLDDTGVDGVAGNAFTISGASYRFGAGGAGANGTATPPSNLGGADGGGASASAVSARGGNGTANSGSGGAGGTTSCSPGGAGGSGVVIIRTSAVKINAITGAGNSVASVSGTVAGPTGNFVLALSSTVGNLNISGADLTTSGATKTAGTGSEKFITYRGTIAQLHSALNRTKITLQQAVATGSIKYELNPVVADSGSTFFNDENGHTYRAVSSTGTYASAVTGANALKVSGLTGYLVNITSAAEQTFQYAKITTATQWIGGRELDTNGNWRWADGPESGTQFLSGNVGGTPSKTTIVGQYQNFSSSEPNNNSGDTVGGSDCAVGNYNSSNQWDDVVCTANTITGYIVEFGGRSTDPGVTSAVVTVTLPTVNVNFEELNFNFTAGNFEYLRRLNTSGTDSLSTVSATTSVTGQTLGDRVLYKNVITRNVNGSPVIVDAVVTTNRLVTGAITAYENKALAGGTGPNFQFNMDLSGANGFAEFQFDFYVRSSSLVTNCNLTASCDGESKVILQNVNVTAFDIDFVQWNDFTGLDSYTVASNTSLRECLLSSITASTTCGANRPSPAISAFPADIRFQGPTPNNLNSVLDQVVVNYGSIQQFKIKFGKKTSGTPNYFGVAFKALPWGGTATQTVGPPANVSPLYNITYNSNSSTDGNAPAMHSGVVGTNFTVSGNTGTLTRTGYTFGGWNTEADGSGDAYAAAAGIQMPLNGQTLYAVWVPSQLTLTYSPNGGTASPANELRLAGAVANLSASAPTRAGFTFGGWSRLEDGSGALLSSGASFTMPSTNTTLYAKWNASTGTIAYAGNDNSSGTAPTGLSGTTGGNYTVLGLGNLDPLAKTGHTFAGWNTQANKSGTDYAAGAVIPFPASGVTLTLHAQWTPILYSLSFNANGGNNPGSGAAPNQSANSGASLTIPASSFDPTRVGFDFGGWNTQIDGLGTNYSAGATGYLMPAANTVLYAKWTAITYNILYDKNSTDATGTLTTATTYAKDAAVPVLPLSSGTITSTVLRFIGWNTLANGLGTDYVPGSTFAMGTANVTLYAKWVAANIVLTFDANGGVGAPPQSNAPSSTAITLPSLAPTREGYNFAGWTENSNGTGTVLTAGGPYTTPASNAILYAKWTPILYIFSYNANGGVAGVGAPTSVTGLNIGSQVTLYVVDGSSAAPTRTGYSFTGWNGAADGSSTSFAPGSKYTMGAGNYSVFAQWLGNPFTLTYSSNGGTALSPSTQVRNAGSVANITGSTPSRSGFTFGGWNTAANGTGTSYASSASLTMPAENVTLFAVWTAVNSGVTYNANNGTGAPSGASHNFGDSVTVSSTTPTRSGFTFTGWNTASGGTGTPYAAGDIFSMPSTAVVLFAQWTATIYSLNYDANGGSGAPGLTQHAFASTTSVSRTVPTRSGYDFQSWNTRAAGDGTARASGDVITIPASDTTLFAQWSLATFTVSYNANGGIGSIPAQPGRFDTTITLSTTEPTRAGYTFGGWNTGTDGSGVNYRIPGNPVGSPTLTIPASNVTLFAKWTAIEYTLTYSANGGTSAPAAVTNKTVGETFALSSSEPTRTGFWFSGWNTQADAAGTAHAKSANYTMPASNVTLYAKWVENTYTVSYNGNGGNGAPPAQTAAGAVTVPASTATVLRPGYTFSHWYTNAAGTGGTSYAPGDSFTPSGNTILYAIWTPLTITVTYNINGGANPNTDTPAPQTGVFDGQAIQLSGAVGFTKSGSTFLTWNTVNDASGTSYAAEDPNFRVPSSNITLYAIWSSTFFAVEYRPNGGTGEPADQFAAPGQTVNVAPTEPQKTGHDFVAWSDVSTGNTYSANSTITMPTANVTLVANWIVKSASVPRSGTPPVVVTPIKGITFPKRLNLTVYFKGDRSFLTEATKTRLRNLATEARKYGTATNITIFGRVKETNDKSYDARLSRARAVNVSNFLKRLGVRGTYRVIAAGISPENKAISRRVDLQLFWTKR